MCMCRVTLVSESWHIHELNGLARMLCSSQHTHTHTRFYNKNVLRKRASTRRAYTNTKHPRARMRALSCVRALSLSLSFSFAVSPISAHTLYRSILSLSLVRALSRPVCVCVSLALSLLLPPLTFSRSPTRFLSRARFLSLPPRLPFFFSSHHFTLPPLQPKQTGCPCILTRRFHGRRSCRPLQYTRGERERERLARWSSWLQGLYK